MTEKRPHYKLQFRTTSIFITVCRTWGQIPTFNISLRRCDVARALCVNRVQFYKPVAITIVPENPLPGVATGAHMIDGILKLDSQRPGHAPVGGKWGQIRVASI
jgi:hypothetical protein